MRPTCLGETWDGLACINLKTETTARLRRSQRHKKRILDNISEAHKEMCLTHTTILTKRPGT